MIRPRTEVGRLSAYRLLRNAPVKLNQNESPVDWPDDDKAQVLARVAAREWNRYPADSDALRRAFARHVGVEPEMVAVTSGSNEGILAVVETFASGRAVVLTAPGYSMSIPLAIVGGAQVRTVRLREDFSLARSLNHNAHRFSLEWSRIEPERGRVDEAALAHYRAVLERSSRTAILCTRRSCRATQTRSIVHSTTTMLYSYHAIMNQRTSTRTDATRCRATKHRLHRLHYATRRHTLKPCGVFYACAVHSLCVSDPASWRRACMMMTRTH